MGPRLLLAELPLLRLPRPRQNGRRPASSRWLRVRVGAPGPPCRRPGQASVLSLPPRARPRRQLAPGTPWPILLVAFLRLAGGPPLAHRRRARCPGRQAVLLRGGCGRWACCWPLQRARRAVLLACCRCLLRLPAPEQPLAGRPPRRAVVGGVVQDRAILASWLGGHTGGLAGWGRRSRWWLGCACLACFVFGLLGGGLWPRCRGGFGVALVGLTFAVVAARWLAPVV